MHSIRRDAVPRQKGRFRSHASWLGLLGWPRAFWVRRSVAGRSAGPTPERPNAALAVLTASWPPPRPGVARERWNEEVNAFLMPVWTPVLTIAKLGPHN